VNDNYIVLNLAAQKTKDISHYKVFKALTQLKKTLVIEQGSLETALYCFDCFRTENVLGVMRRFNKSVVVLIVNFENTKEVTVDVKTWFNISEQLIIYAPSVDSKLLPGSRVNITSVTLPGSASVVLTTADLFE